MNSALDFSLPAELEESEPPEARGLARDEVRLMAASGEGIADRDFTDLPSLLAPGDVVVVNTSATLAAAVPTLGGDLIVHLGGQLPGGLWLVELRQPAGAGSRPHAWGRRGGRLELPAEAAVELLAPYPVDDDAAPHRLWLAVVRTPGALLEYLAVHGRPIRYGYAGQAWPLSAYQTIFADEPGSAEMPSAGRAFSARVLEGLKARDIAVVPLVLHTGVSSQEAGEPPYPERFSVPLGTAEAANAARDRGGRVIAVGTTVTRALETVADVRGRVHPGAGWTDLVITPVRGVRAIDGILTGWHAPQASHLALLEAVAGRALLTASYERAVAQRYRWHEFGDLHLLLR